MIYDGFISYSHAAGGLLAPRLQAGLQRFAKPWWKRRAVRIFRDESSLSANPHWWSSITEALDTSLVDQYGSAQGGVFCLSVRV